MTDNKDPKRKNSNRVFMGSGNYNPEIKGDYIQGDVISFGKAPTPTPERKDLSKDGEAIDVDSKEV
jgi:hypothetical protein